MASAYAANTVYSFTGVASDGRTLSFQYTAPALISSATVVASSQAGCSPACEDIGLFPNAQLNYDLVVVDVRNPNTTPTAFSFYFPAGSLAAVGAYKTTSSTSSNSSGSLTVAQTGAPVVTTTAMPNGAVGVPYLVTLTGQGGSGALSYTIAGGALPAGLTLSSGGVISGTPSASGTAQVSIRVTDAAQSSTTRTFSLKIAQGLTITTLSPLASGTLGLSYLLTLGAAGGSPSYTWTLESGSLPPGLSLSPGGAISGTPFSGGSYAFTLRVTDTTAATVSQVFTLSIASVLSITANTTLPGGSVGSSYAAPLTVVGGQAPYTWTLTSGALPPGLTLSSQGLITGTPTTATTNSNFGVKVQDSGSNLATQTFSITIGVGLTISTVSSLPSGVVGAPYSASLAAAGGSPAYTWNISSGSLPAGLSLSPLGVISGTPTTAGTTTFFARVADAAANSATLPISISILPSLQITTVSPLPNATPNVAYSQTLAAAGGSPPYGWTRASGNLPTGLDLSPTGLLAGTPTTTGTYNFVARVTDTNNGYTLQSFNLTVGSSLNITTSSPLPNAPLGLQYAQTLAVSGGTAPYTFSLQSGSLPVGLSISTTGLISGIPTTAGTSSFAVMVADSGGLTTSKSFQLTAGAQGFNIDSPSTLPSGVVGTAYSQTLTASGGTQPLSWISTSGALPPGLGLSSTGVIAGTPTTVGSYMFDVRVTDGNSQVATKTMTITVTLTGTSSLTITTTSPLPAAPLNQVYTQTLAGSGGTPPYIWTFSGGSIPPGLSMTTSGILSGTPITAGTYNFTILLTDATGATAQGTFSLTVGSGLFITTSSTLPGGTVGVSYAQAIAASGGTTPYIFSLQSGSLPSGLQLNTSGIINGTPLAAGTSTFTVRVQDAVGASTTGNFTLTISSIGTGGIAISPTTLPGGSLGVFYSQTLTGSGGSAPYIFSLLSGTLPPGLTISSGGVVSGTPTSSGTFPFNVRVTDSQGSTGTQLYTISIGASIQITTTTLPAGSVNTFYSQTLAATGGTSPYSWSINSGALPTGIFISTLGIISGTPTSGGTYAFVVRVADATGASTTQSYTLIINGGIVITTPSPLPDGSVGSTYFLTFGASGGTGPYAWSVTAGAMPTGLTLSTNGTLTGVPTAQGQFQFTVKIVDGSGLSSTAPFTITINSGTTLPRAGIIAQLASGGSWKTTIVLLNPTSSPAQVRVNLMAEDGTPLILPMTVTQSTSSVTVSAAVVDRSIPANGTLLIESEAMISTTTVGWADVRSSAAISGYAIFRQHQGDGHDAEGTSPLETKYPTNVLVTFDQINGYSTGVALVNLDTAGSLTAILRDDSGNELTRDIVTLGANGHTSFSLAERFPILSGRRGTVEFVNNQSTGIVALGLRFSPSLSFTSLPVTGR